MFRITDLFFLIPLLVYPANGQVFGTLYTSADWYVDSINGSDSSTGKLNSASIPQPYQTISHLQAQSISSGQSICLNTGSTWRDSFTPPADNISLLSCGAGSAPLIDGSNLISAGSWTKTAGLTNTYQISVTLPTSAASAWENIWENGAFMLAQASCALVDVNTGTYYSTANTGAATICVHSSSGIPTTNGKTYEYAAQLDTIAAQNVNYTKVIGIRTRRSILSQGSLALGPYSYVYGATAEDGGLHNIYAHHDSFIYNTSMTEAYCGPLCGYILFVGFDTSVTSGQAAASCINCTATLSASPYRGGAAFDTHTSGTTFANSTFLGSVVTGMDLAFGAANTANLIIGRSQTRRTTINIPADANAVGVQAGTPVTISGTDFVAGACTNCSAVVMQTNNNPLTMSASTISAAGGNSGLTGINGGFQSGLTISVIGTTFTGVGMPVVMLATEPSVTLTGNSYASTVTQVYNIATPTVFLSDFNAFNSDFTSAVLGVATYHSLASWQSGTGQDQHSTP